MKDIVKGMFAWSRAGHDTDKLYIIVGLDQEFAYLSDGRLRTLENPKKKRWKHIQTAKQISEELETKDWTLIKNEDIKRAIKIKMCRERNQEG